MATVYKVNRTQGRFTVFGGLGHKSHSLFNYLQIPSFATYPIVPLVPNMHQRISALGWFLHTWVSQQLFLLVAMRRLYAGSVSYDATEEDIKEMFKPYGNITCLTISWDEEKNHHKVAWLRLSLSVKINFFRVSHSSSTTVLKPHH